MREQCEKDKKPDTHKTVKLRHLGLQRKDVARAAGLQSKGESYGRRKHIILNPDCSRYLQHRTDQGLKQDSRFESGLRAGVCRMRMSSKI